MYFSRPVAGDPGQVVGQAEVGQQQLELRFAFADGLVGRHRFAARDPGFDPGFGRDDFVGVRERHQLRVGRQRDAEPLCEAGKLGSIIEPADLGKDGRLRDGVPVRERFADGAI